MKKWKSYLLFAGILAVVITEKTGSIDWWMMG